jgi:hypothetical protein
MKAMVDIEYSLYIIMCLLITSLEMYLLLRKMNNAIFIVVPSSVWCNVEGWIVIPLGRVITQYVPAQSPRQVKQDWRKKGVTYHCHLNRKPLSV